MNEITFNHNSFVARSAVREDARAILAFLAKYFEDNANVEQICSWIDKFKDSITIIVSAENQNIVGVFKRLPLSISACKLIEEEILTGTLIHSEHMISDLTSAPAMWLGDLAVDGSKYQRGVILAKHVLPNLNKSTFTGTIYARASKKEGYDLLMRYGFKFVNLTLNIEHARNPNNWKLFLNRIMKRHAF